MTLASYIIKILFQSKNEKKNPLQLITKNQIFKICCRIFLDILYYDYEMIYKKNPHIYNEIL